jgi:Domain of unknown function (DUF4263)
MGQSQDRNEIAHELIVEARRQYTTRYGNDVIVDTVVVRPGPRAWKTASLLTFPNPETGEVRKHQLRTQTWNLDSRQQGDGYDFTQSDFHWHCENHEIEAVRAFLNNQLSEPGKYRIIQRESDIGELLERVENGKVDVEHVAKLIQLTGRIPDMATALAHSRAGALLAEAVELQRRRDQLEELRNIVEDPDSTERDHIHPQLKKMGWIFGGRYVGESERRQLTVGDVFDVPLLRGDGSLHIVELKRANIPGLIHRYRGPSNPLEINGHREELPLIVGTEVHEAMGQAMNYLCHLDEQRDHILAKFKIEARRASATVLIGHPGFVTNFTPEEIANTLRIYNSHHARIEVMHYGDLIENAARALALASLPLSDQDSDEPGLNGETSASGKGPGFDQASDWSDPWSEAAPDLFSDEPPF